MFLSSNFVALTPFQRRYGVEVDASTNPPTYAIETKWQSALFQSGQCGAFVGVFLAGPITNRLGYRWTTILALILMNATIFVSFFVSSFPRHRVSEEAKRQGGLTRPCELRPTPWAFSPPAKLWKVSPGVSSLPTPLPMPAKLCLWFFEGPPRLRCK